MSKPTGGSRVTRASSRPHPRTVLPTRPLNPGQLDLTSPFRYPGGKSWLVPTALEFTSRHAPTRFVEPFAGGASVACAVLTEHLHAHVTLNELDGDVAAVWQVVFSSQGEALARRVLSFDLTWGTVDALLASPPDTLTDQAFATIVRNRVNHAGILAPGAGRTRRGERDAGLSQRWYPETLARRIRTLSACRSRVTVTSEDALTLLERPHAPGTVMFLDPPYTFGPRAPGTRLYRHAALDHVRLMDATASLRVPFLMSHQNTPEVRALAWERGLQTRDVAMITAHNARQGELLISRDFRCAERGAAPAVLQPGLFSAFTADPHPSRQRLDQTQPG